VGTVTAEAGTLLHELGHTFFLTHGGTFFPHGAATSSPLAGQQGNNPLGVPSYGLNCNPGFLSSMNYLFQIRGFPDLLADGSHPIDYSGQTLPSLSETALDESIGIGSDMFTSHPAPHFTRWYAPPNALDTQLQNTTGGRFASFHCDGTPVKKDASGNILEPAVRVDGSTFSAPIDWNNDLIVPDLDLAAWQDVNFNGSTSSSPDAPFPGFNDWVNFDSRQIAARSSAFGLSGGGGNQFGGGGNQFGGGGNQFGGGGNQFGGGGNQFGGGGNQFGGGGTEQDQETACSTADPPTALSAVQSKSTVVLSWKAPELCQVQKYDIWRSTNNGPFTNIGNTGRVNNGTGAPLTTFTDSKLKNNTTYTYFVTDTNTQGAQSGASAPVTIFVSF
jgi:hypothetical protein